MPASVPADPARELAVITCMDARILPDRALGLDLGDAHVLRNAGGRVTDDVLRSLIASSHFLGTRAAMVVHHSGCGMLAADPTSPRRTIESAVGRELGDLDLMTFSDPEQAVREDLARIHTSPLLPPTFEARGFILDLASGLLREVAPAAEAA